MVALANDPKCLNRSGLQATRSVFSSFHLTWFAGTQTNYNGLSAAVIASCWASRRRVAGGFLGTFHMRQDLLAFRC